MKKKILLGVTGSISAYKSAEIARGLVGTGYDVQVVMTSNGARFISPLTLETLTKNKVYVDMFKDEDHSEVTHINLANESDLILIAPASYNIIGKAAAGLADDLLSTVIAATSPEKLVFAPAMNVNMYNNPILIENIKKLKKIGVTFIEPDEGALACGVKAKGRLRNVPYILDTVEFCLHEKPLKGKKVMITAGATREYIDPIRFISNTSSGLMGVSLARACRNMGADVTLIIANSQYELEDVKTISVDTVAQMYKAAIGEFQASDLVFCAAAVSDYKPTLYNQAKLKKKDSTFSIDLQTNTDILLELGKLKKEQILVGFAAESENMLENALSKLKNKNLDMIVANDLSNFSSDKSKVWLLTHETSVELERKSKAEVAYHIVEQAVNLSKEWSDKL